jgi:hypothetical protein
MERGTRVRIVSDDPTKYFRLGRSATPTTQIVGTVTGTALKMFLRRPVIIAAVDWDNGTSGTYYSNALVGVE